MLVDMLWGFRCDTLHQCDCVPVEWQLCDSVEGPISPHCAPAPSRLNGSWVSFCPPDRQSVAVQFPTCAVNHNEPFSHTEPQTKLPSIVLFTVLPFFHLSHTKSFALLMQHTGFAASCELQSHLTRSGAFFVAAMSVQTGAEERRQLARAGVSKSPREDPRHVSTSLQPT